MTDEAPADDHWCAGCRQQVLEYLRDQGLAHGAIGDWPAWHIAPYVSIWALESVKAPGRIGWWAICGDLPTDYCSADGRRHPRLAMRTFAHQWRDSAATLRLGDRPIEPSLAELLAARADVLSEWAADDGLWDAA